MKNIIFLFATFFIISNVNAQPYGPYNQQYTINQQYGSTNWYSSPLGQGVAQAGVTLIGGLVNMMNKPDPVQYIQPQQPVYTNQQQMPNYGYGNGNGGCTSQLYTVPGGSPQMIKVCPP